MTGRSDIGGGNARDMGERTKLIGEKRRKREGVFALAMKAVALTMELGFVPATG